VKQTGVWRLVAAAMAEPDATAARRHLDALAASPTAAVVDVAVRLCRSARADERRAGVALVDAVLDTRPDHGDAPRLRDARSSALARG